MEPINIGGDVRSSANDTFIDLISLDHVNFLTFFYLNQSA
jgi:hypothetical protein